MAGREGYLLGGFTFFGFFFSRLCLSLLIWKVSHAGADANPFSRTSRDAEARTWFLSPAHSHLLAQIFRD
jgi:hypothetical protein